jgi:hypothetical protein
MPRYFGIGFNPVSIYYCYGGAEAGGSSSSGSSAGTDRNGPTDGEGGRRPSLIVLEVNNTFGETFLYWLHPGRQLGTARRGCGRPPTPLHASP